MPLKDLILKPVFLNLAKLKKHKVVAGLPKYQVLLSCDKNNPCGKFYVSARKIDKAKNLEYHSESHSHMADSALIFIGSRNRLKGLKSEVMLDNKKFVVDSPCGVYLPAGLRHTHRYVSGSGFFLKVLLTDGKNFNELTK